MSSIRARLDRIEKQIGQAACVCSEPEHSQMAFVVIEDDWGTEDIDRAEASARFTCPIHGDRSPPILRLSQTDARL
jgi:hypothetical protein